MSDAPRAVFLSYASQDAAAAQRISDALRDAGIEVWFDQSELVGGDAWDQKIRRQIKECALLIPIISSAAEARTEGYFRLEWRLADQRTHLMAKGRPFLLPVVIDGTRDSDAHVPDSFTEVQWTRLPGGETSPAFVQRVQALLAGTSSTSAHAAPAPAVAYTPITAARVRPSWVLPSVAAALVGVVAFLFFVLTRHEERTVPPQTPSRAPSAESSAAAVERRESNPAASVVPATASVAVLPFNNLSAAKENEYFSDGISEELLTVLQKIPGLKVSARTSSFSFKDRPATAQEIGEKLGVANLVEGSVRRSGSQVRITARLSRAATGEQLWSESYTRDLKDVFAVQSELALAIVAELRGRLTGATGGESQAELANQVASAQGGGTANAQAHELYLQGKYFSNQPSIENLAKAAGYFQRAVDLDPAFALAWANLGRMTAIDGEYMNASLAQVEKTFARARAATERSLQLNPNLAEGYFARYEIQSSRDFNWRGSQDSIQRALALAPSDAMLISNLSQLTANFGDVPKAIQLGKQAVELDPVNGEIHYWLAVAYLGLGELKSAEQELKRAMELSPSLLAVHRRLSLVYALQGRAPEALTEARLESLEWSRQTALALAYSVAGNKRASDVSLARLIEIAADSASYQVAEVSAFRGEASAAFDWLERALRNRDAGLGYLRLDPLFKKLHDDPRWPAFVRKAGLSDEQLNPG